MISKTLKSPPLVSVDWHIEALYVEEKYNFAGLGKVL